MYFIANPHAHQILLCPPFLACAIKLIIYVVKAEMAYLLRKTLSFSSFLGNDDVTVGKFYATFLIQEWFRRWKLKKAEEHKHLPYGQVGVDIKQSFDSISRCKFSLVIKCCNVVNGHVHIWPII